MKFLLICLRLSDRCLPACCSLVRLWSTADRIAVYAIGHITKIGLTQRPLLARFETSPAAGGP